MDAPTLQQAIDAALKTTPFSIGGAALDSPAITTLLVREFGADALVIAGATQAAQPDGSITVSGTLTAAWLGAPAGLTVDANFAIVDAAAVLTATITGFASPWSLSTPYPLLQGSLFDEVTYAHPTFVLSSAGIALPDGFPANFGLPAYPAAYSATLPPPRGFSASLTPGSGLAWTAPLVGSGWGMTGSVTAAADVPSIALATTAAPAVTIGGFSLAFSAALASAALPPAPDPAPADPASTDPAPDDPAPDDDDPTSDPQPPAALLQLGATLTSGTLQVPVVLRALSPDVSVVTITGDLTDLSATTLDEIGTLVGAPIGSQMASDFPALSDIGLRSVALAVTTATRDIVSASATIGLVDKPNWSLFDGLVVFDGLAVTFTWIPSSGSFSTSVDASATFSGGTLDADITMPDGEFSCDLAAGTTIDISKVVSDVSGGSIAMGTVTCTALQLTGSATENYYRFNATVTENWSFTVPGSTAVLALTGVAMDLSYTPGATVPLSGAVMGDFTIAGVALTALAERDATSGDWIFGAATAGSVTVDVHDLVADAAKFLGLPAPDQTPDVTLLNLNMRFNATTHEFDFTGLAQATIAGVPCDLGVELSRAGTTTLFHGYLWIGDEAFDLDFSTGTSTVLAGSWVAESDGAVLDLRVILAELGSTFDFLPTSIDLTLNAAEILYDTAGTLILIGDSDAYGDFAFVSTKGADGTSLWGVAAQAKGAISLSDLPLVGADLAKVATLDVAGLQISASGSPLGTAAALLNAALQNGAYQSFYPKGVTYPTFPTVDPGQTAQAIVSGKLDYPGGSLPFQLPLGGAAPAQPAQGPTPTPTPPPPPAPVPGAPVQVTAASDGTLWYNLQKAFGPVSIQRVGLRYDKPGQRLWFELDAALTFGPLSISLLGLGIGSPISSFSPDFTLQGLGIAYSQPPLTIAGSLVNLTPPGAPGVAFEGSLVIETTSFSVEAIGYYGDPGGAAGFPSLFVFLASSFAVGGPPAFTVTGLAGGFGYNSNLSLPSIGQLAGFPFLAMLPDAPAPNPGVLGGSSPQTALASLTAAQPPWVSPDKGQIWVAAGLTFTSFELVHGAAMLIVEAGDELEIALLGSAYAQFPQPGAPAAEGVYARVVLDVEARFLPQRGIFSIEAVLTPGSFLLDPACVLTGGFAFYIWYGPSQYAGDFVLTLGGYHSAFQAPAWYPTVPRIGFHWPLDDSITVQGGAYLAVTPSAMMAGGALDVTFRSGNLRAWLNAHCDLIIRWKPFWISIDVGISIGASYKVDLLFTSVTLSVELGCELELWGPPTAGRVHVDWYVISFTIHFGADTSTAPPAAVWSDVDAVLPKAGGSAITLDVGAGLVSDRASPAPPAPSPGGTALLASATVAADPPATAPPSASAPLVVRAAAFAFTTHSPIPASSATTGSGSVAGDAFCVHPLGWSGVEAVHTVTFTDDAGTDLTGAFAIEGVFGAVPTGLWGSPPETSQPQVPDGTTATVGGQLTGLSFTVHPPATGATAGPVDAGQDLAHDPLDLPGAALPIAAGAAAAGDQPASSTAGTLAISDPTTGIGAPATGKLRGAIFDALTAAGVAPPANDDMQPFADAVGCQFAAEPLIVS